jgi:Ger(x)C family germination protein
MRRLINIVPFVLCIILLCGCWDRHEINDIAFVLGAAVDREKDGYRVSVVIPLTGNLSGPVGGGGASGKKPYTIQSEVGVSPHEALDKLQLQLSRKLYFAHSRLVLVGEDVMKEGIEPFMDSALRISETRLTTLIATTKGKAIDLLSTDVKLERFPVEAMREILESDASIHVSLKDIVLEMNTTGSDAMLPYLELVTKNKAKEKSEEIRATGYVLTKGGKEVAVIQGDEANGIRLLKGHFKPFSDTITTDSGVASIIFNNSKLEIKPYLKGNEIHFNINVYVQGNLTEDIGAKDTFSDIPMIEKILKHRLESQIKQLIVTSTHKKSDIIGFGHILNRYYPKNWESKWEPEWDDMFSMCHFHVSVSATVFGVGMIRENLVIRER